MNALEIIITYLGLTWISTCPGNINSKLQKKQIKHFIYLFIYLLELGRVQFEQMCCTIITVLIRANFPEHYASGSYSQSQTYSQNYHFQQLTASSPDPPSSDGDSYI